MTRKVVTVDAVTNALPTYIVGGSDLLTVTEAPALIEDVVTPMLQGLGPVASWVQSGNKTATVTAVDIDTNTFTSTGHALVDGDKIVPYLNGGLKVPLRQYLPGGLSGAAYFVVGATADTFQVSATLGGAALDLTSRATQDLTKWHFETFSTFNGFTGLSLGRARFVIKGQFFHAAGSTLWLRPMANLSEVFATSGTLAANGMGYGGPVWGIAQVDVVFDGRSLPSVMGSWLSVGQLAATADGTLVNKSANDNLMTTLPPATITSLTVTTGGGVYEVAWANGSIMEVYTQ